ncbi:hypothetical protein HY745_10460, partial [Candidatus Desantisbacteria bacterium]|nr:hypothetical protein [Candidatus Desantisbacteria bacterium]
KSTIKTTIKSKYFIRTVSNEFDPYTIRELVRNVLDTEELFSEEFIELNARQFISEKKEQTYSLILVYRGEKGFQAKGKEPLILLVDGERFAPEKVFPERNFTKQKEFRDRVQEEETFRINTEILKKIAYAKEVKVKITSDKRSIVAKFSDANILGYREFYEKFIK